MMVPEDVGPRFPGANVLSFWMENGQKPAKSQPNNFFGREFWNLLAFAAILDYNIMGGKV